jgi:hypothetical protein
MRGTFKPFRPEDFDSLLKRTASVPDTYFPTALELPKTMRGYAELQKIYRAICLGGRRSETVHLEQNPSDPYGRNVLNILQANFEVEHTVAAHVAGIVAHSTSVCINNRTSVQSSAGREFFMLAEVLDSSLKPTLLGPGLIETFGTGPVATVLYSRPDDDLAVSTPIFTAMSFREMARTVVTTPLPDLKKLPCPSFGYMLLCEAIYDRVYSSPRSSGDMGSRGGQAPLHHSEPRLDLSEQEKLLGMSAEMNEISVGIRKIDRVGTSLTPGFTVECEVDGTLANFEVWFLRNYRTGQARGVAFER